MISVTRLNGEEIIINADMIEFIEVTPDTIISMISGKKILVMESSDAVQEKMIEYQQKIHGVHPLEKRDKKRAINSKKA
jgi:flagellar protein FlbD